VSYSSELLATANRLLSPAQGQEVSRSDCNRAVSTVYYAVFDCLCSAVADRIAGREDDDEPPSEVWIKIYRSIDHTQLRDALFRVAPAKPEERYSPANSIATAFKKCLDARQDADYDRRKVMDCGAARSLLNDARNVVLMLGDGEIWKLIDGSDRELYVSQLIAELLLPRQKR
jgi:hypothetical protein